MPCSRSSSKMDAGSGKLQARNVELFVVYGGVIAGFWQYGTTRWDEFYRYLTEFITPMPMTDWTIFQYDPAMHQPHNRGEPCLATTAIVQPGSYMLLSSSGEPIHVGLLASSSRRRNPTPSSTPDLESNYRDRSLARDRKCLITGLQAYSRLKVVHIFPRGHGDEWIRNGYPSKITDTADVGTMGGWTKIDSVQNVITLRGDLRDAWVNYEFGVDPNDNYRITAFTNGNADINGRYLQLDHIQDPTLYPLNELFTDHFIQGLLKHMKGPGESHLTDEVYCDAFEYGPFDLSNSDIWGTREGKQQFELTLAERLFDHRISQEYGDTFFSDQGMDSEQHEPSESSSST